MLVGVYENNDQWKFAPGIHKMARLHSLAPQKSTHRVHCGCGKNVLVAQIVEDLHVQWTILPLVAFGEIDRNLNCHRVWHFTALSLAPCLQLRRPGTTHCC